MGAQKTGQHKMSTKGTGALKTTQNKIGGPRSTMSHREQSPKTQVRRPKRRPATQGSKAVHFRESTRRSPAQKFKTGQLRGPGWRATAQQFIIQKVGRSTRRVAQVTELVRRPTARKAAAATWKQFRRPTLCVAMVAKWPEMLRR